MKPEYVDFHAHLDLYPDLAGAIKACDARRTATLSVTTTPKAFARNRELAARSQFVRVGIGLHPQLVAERADEIGLFESLLPQSRYVGEVGLDAGPRHYRSFDLQKAVFRRILELCANAGGKILSVHSVRSARAVLDLVEELLPADRGTTVLHWFTGSASEMRRAVDLGCYFSVNEEMLRSDRGERIAGEMPADRILTETDGPFVTRGGSAVPPGDVSRAVKQIANIRSEVDSTIRTQVLQNFAALIDSGPGKDLSTPAGA